MKMALVVMALALFGSVNAFAVNPEAPFKNLVLKCTGQTAIDLKNNVFTLDGYDYDITALGFATYQMVGRAEGFTKTFNFGNYRVAELQVVKVNKEYSFNIFVNFHAGDGFTQDAYGCVPK